MRVLRRPLIAIVALLLLVPLLFLGDYVAQRHNAAMERPEFLLEQFKSQLKLPARTGPPEYPFEHPAAEEAREIFLKLPVNSEADYRQLPRRDRYLWDVKWYEAEVMNGGIDQFFYNSTGDHAAETLEALEAIGAKGSHQDLQKAFALFPRGVPSPDREKRIAQLRAICGNKHLDDLLPAGDMEVDLYQLLLDYYRKADPNGK